MLYMFVIFFVLQITCEVSTDIPTFQMKIPRLRVRQGLSPDQPGRARAVI